MGCFVSKANSESYIDGEKITTIIKFCHRYPHYNIYRVPDKKQRLYNTNFNYEIIDDSSVSINRQY